MDALLTPTAPTAPTAPAAPQKSTKPSTTIRGRVFEVTAVRRPRNKSLTKAHRALQTANEIIELKVNKKTGKSFLVNHYHGDPPPLSEDPLLTSNNDV